ncbi:MAG: DUF5808 domain-containing protein [Polyangia bacterium]
MNARRPSLFSKWDLWALAGLTGLLVHYARLVPRMPDPVPTHFNAAGNPNGWTSKTHLPLVVFAAPVFIWLVLFLFGAVAAAAKKESARAQLAAFQALRGFLTFGTSFLLGSCLAMALWGMPALHTGLVVFFIFLGLGLIFMIREIEIHMPHVHDPDHYRCGLFYVNPDDDRLWVPKRIGMGWTLNYARPAAYWITAFILILVGVVLWLSLHTNGVIFQ